MRSSTLILDIGALDRVHAKLRDRADKRRVAGVARNLRHALGPGVYRTDAARSFGVSAQALDRWLDRGAIPVAGHTGGGRVLLDTEAVIAIASHAEAARAKGCRRPLAPALAAYRQAHPEAFESWEPNESPAQLRQDHLGTDEAQRLAAGIELSEFAVGFAQSSREARRRAPH